MKDVKCSGPCVQVIKSGVFLADAQARKRRWSDIAMENDPFMPSIYPSIAMLNHQLVMGYFNQHGKSMPFKHERFLIYKNQDVNVLKRAL